MKSEEWQTTGERRGESGGFNSMIDIYIMHTENPRSVPTCELNFKRFFFFLYYTQFQKIYTLKIIHHCHIKRKIKLS